MTDSETSTDSARKTMLRNMVAIDGRDFLLAQSTDIDELKQVTATTFRSGGGFVDFVVVGNRSVSAYCTTGVAVIFESHTVEYDERDTGDVSYPFDETAYGL